jgi:hypothetical protein
MQPIKSCVQSAILCSVLLVTGIARSDSCPAANNNDAASKAWSAKLVQAIAEDPACTNYAPQATSLDRSACNIFVGRVLEKVYGVADFTVSPPDPNKKFYTANEIAARLAGALASKWEWIGNASVQATLDSAKARGDEGRLVVAVWKNPDPRKPGHVALIGPGPLVWSGAWGLRVPNSAQFKLDDPSGDYLSKPLSCAFRKDIADQVEIWVRRR